jgi:pimeloyl-ACP methyl ester carboxylesterase
MPLRILSFAAPFLLVFAGVGAASAGSVPVMTRVSTGSELAVWTLAAEAPQPKITPVVFLHGGPGLYTEERRFAEGAPLRAAGFATIYFDQAGGGKSGRLPAAAYTLDRAVSDLEALRIALGKDQLILWGNSWGASLSALYAARYPARVAGIILTSPGTFPGTDVKRDYSGTNRDRVTYSDATRMAIAQVDREGAAAEAGLSQDRAGKLLDDLVAAELIDAMVCKGSASKTALLPGGGNLYANRLLSRELKKAGLAPVRLNVPVLILRGTCDFLPLANAERYRATFGGSIVPVPNAGHGLFENRAVTDGAFRNFANEILAKAVK